MSELPMDSVRPLNEVSNETKVADGDQQGPHLYESSQNQSEKTVDLETTNVNLVGIEDHRWWSILNILCCCMMLGCVAFYFSSKTDKSKKRGDRQAALNASRNARKFNYIATILGFILLILYIIRLSFVRASDF